MGTKLVDVKVLDDSPLCTLNVKQRHLNTINAN